MNSFAEPLLAFVLALATVAAVEGLLAYIRRRDKTATADRLPDAGRIALGLVTFAAIALLIVGRPLTSDAALRAVWAAVFAVVFAIDLRTHLILDVVSGPTILLALLAAAVLGSPSIVDAVLGGVVGLLLFGIIFAVGVLVFRRAAIGLGDVKFAAVIGATVGGSNVLLALLVGIFLGGFISLGLLVSGRVKLSDAPAYGTYLAIGGYTALLQMALATR